MIRKFLDDYCLDLLDFCFGFKVICNILENKVFFKEEMCEDIVF